MFAYRNKMLAASSLSPARVASERWRLTEPASPDRAPSRDFPLLRMSAAAACLIGAPAIAHAVWTAPSLAPGTTYELIFVTSTVTQAADSTLADYNTFVQDAAALDPSLPKTTWTAIASTEAEAATSNIASCAGCEVFLVDGTEAATNQADLFSGGSLLHAINEDENGNTVNSYVWTGSTTSGDIDGGSALGDAYVGIGDSSSTSASGFLSTYPYALTNNSSLPLYAISGQLTVPGSSMPEPMSGSLLLAGGAATGLVRRLRRRARPVA